jgi:hypothetical protein
MITKKSLYTLLICLTIVFVFVPHFLSFSEPPCSYHPESYRDLEMSQLSQQLTTTGLIGRIHGAVGESAMFVLSVREPDNFFSHREFSLLSNNRETLDSLKQVKRHDQVCIQGSLIANPSPQKHIALNEIKVLESWSGPKGFTAEPRQGNLLAQLGEQTSFLGKVHAVGEDGQILVVEYLDSVIPLFVTATEYTQGLYRGDIVKLFYKIQQRPQQPTHLQLDTTVEKPLEVIDALSAWHNRRQTLTGNLVKFPQSPQLKFDVYAMAVDIKGIKRYFTLVNFDNLEEFENIQKKLAKMWQENLATATAGRNMLINPEVKIQASGLINVVSPEQANPQILLDSAEQVQQLL